MILKIFNIDIVIYICPVDLQESVGGVILCATVKQLSQAAFGDTKNLRLDRAKLIAYV